MKFIKEKKLEKLIDIAIENGWKPSHDVYQVHKLFPDCFQYVTKSRFYGYYDLNSLVTNYENNELSFIKALCKSTVVDDSIKETRLYTLAEFVVSWVFKPTSQRLDYLFQTFNHLL